MTLLKSTLVIGIILSTLAIAYADKDTELTKVPYPEGYRSWEHVKSMLIQSGHPYEDAFKGIHHIYADDKAMQGLKNGYYSEGARFVFDLLEAVEKDKTIQEGPRKLIAVMHKDTEQFSQTGGWGFEGFAGNSHITRIVTDGGNACFKCHTPMAEKGHVFSELRD